jgi:uncharacterized protein YoxC
VLGVILVYFSLAILAISIGMLVLTAISFKKKTMPTFSFFSSVGGRMQEENNVIQSQVELMKIKQEQIKNDLNWKKAVIKKTMDEIKKLPNTFKSSSKQKMNEFERGI